MQLEGYDNIFKIISSGEASTGKSSLLLRFCNNTFSELYDPTIGIEFGSKTVELENKKRIKLQIWDSSGQERFRAIISSYYRGAHAVILMYDTTNRESFEKIERY